MFSKYPLDTEPDEEGGRQPDSDDSSVVFIDPNQCNDGGKSDSEAAVCASDVDQGVTVLQMAFLQLMTQKVIEATTNCPEVLEHLNASIRTDQD